MPFARLTYLFLCIIVLFSCSVNKFIPEGEYLLDDVEVVSNTNAAAATKAKGYVRQQPNSKWFSLVKVPMYTYALSGSDTTKWRNRTLQKLGEAPVIYDSDIAEISRRNIEQMLVNEGYLHATVDFDTVCDVNKKRTVATYYLHERERYYVSDIDVSTGDTAIETIIDSCSAESYLKPGMPFSVDNMEYERRRLTTILRNKGYWRFRKDYITFNADTTHHSNKVNLTMNVSLYAPSSNSPAIPHKVYRIGDISYISGAGLRLDETVLSGCDTMNLSGYTLLYKDGTIVHPRVLVENTYISSGELFSQDNIDRTYNAFAQLTALKYTTIRLVERTDTALLDCYIMYERSNRRSVGFELEGTNTAGDLGAAASVTFSDKNLFGGSELLSLRLFGAYEAVSDLSGYTGDSYTEYGADLSLRLLGGIASSFVPFDRRMQLSSTLFSLKFNSQERPEFSRRILSGSWSYMWSKRKDTQHKLDIIDLNYIYVPWISDTFKKEYLDSISNRNSILKYNYENLLITKLGYTYSYNSSLDAANRFNRVAYSLRAGVECSGNMLYAANNLFGGSTNSDGQYTFLNIAYAQYIKGDFDFTSRVKIDDRNSFVLHLGLGVAYPYGNSRILPFEKRYFSGGANGMRGWTVRSLGPGRYKNNGRSIDFINQSGDMKLDINLEYRSYLFWKLHSAVFVDAGNIWTIRAYDEQPGGMFDVGTFYKDIAFSYGLGLRFELDLFVFRLDAAMKAVNPAFTGSAKYPITNPKFSRDFALHFAIGYPF
ncbi:MAG: BamA/TamA family outer membrane protein [Bacteroidaceae bacterium]|nr:BamA/TamA family outer membrane protein [Bacteroidaceae bacterium]